MLINTIVITVLNCIVFLLHYHSPQDPIIWGSTAQRTGDRIVRALWPTSSDAALVASYLGAQTLIDCVVGFVFKVISLAFPLHMYVYVCVCVFKRLVLATSILSLCKLEGHIW